MKIKDFERYQIYKDRNPKWICLHRSLLDDPDWFALPKDTAWFVSMLWLLASEDKTREGLLPSRAKIAFRLRMTTAEVDKHLSRLDHWVLSDDTDSYSSVSNCIPYTESESDTDTESDRELEKKIPPPKRRGAHLCPENWTPSEDDLEWAEEKGFLRTQIDNATESMIFWSQGNGKRRSKWGLVWRNWLKREGAGSKVGTTSDQRSAAKWSSLHEQARALNLSASGERGDNANAVVSRNIEPSAPNASRLIEAVPDDPD